MVAARRKDETIEIKDLDDLFRVVKAARAEDEPLVLAIDDDREIVLPPAPRRKMTPEERAAADYEVMMPAAGSWKGLIDRDEFMRQVREGRNSNRPPAALDEPEE